jgi:glutamate racemase
MAQSEKIDTILLACTHYPVLLDKIRAYLPQHIKVVPQGDIVADSLEDYLHRHPEIDAKLTRGRTRQFYTTSDDTGDFDHHATMFFGEEVKSSYIPLK